MTALPELSAATKQEISALIRLGVFEVNKRPHDSNALQNKWVNRTKTDAEGKVERFKPLSVASVNEHKFEVDYFLTFAALMDMPTVKIVLALAVVYGFSGHHWDVTRHTHQPSFCDCNLANRIARYLRGEKTIKLYMIADRSTSPPLNL